MTMLKKNFFSAAEAYAAPVCETLDLTINEGIMKLSTDGNSINSGTMDVWENEL